MGADWKKVRLGELVSIRHGYPFESEHCRPQEGGGPIVLSIGHFQKTGGLLFDGKATKEYTRDCPDEYKLAPGDLLLVMTCQTRDGEILGLPAFVPDDGRMYLHNQRIGRVCPKSSEMDLEFLFWVFRSPDFRQYLCRTASGTKILHTAPSRIEAYELLLPSRSTQRTIARILGAFDEKIALNRKTGETLESIARALFRAWFVDIAAPPSPKRRRGREAFRVGRISDLVELQRGFDLPASERKPGEFPVIGASGPGERQSVAKIKGPGVVVGRSGVIGSVFLVQEDFWPLNTTLWVNHLRGVGPYFAYCALRELGLERLGTGSAVPTLNRNHVHALPCLIPPRHLARAFDKSAEKYFRLRDRLERQSESMGKLRDELLPRLLRGEIEPEALPRESTDEMPGAVSRP